MISKPGYWLIVIVILAFGFRLYHLTTPLADWHSWRQADTASVAREYLKNGIDLLHPRYHDLSNIPSGKDNLHGYRMVEFPIINALVTISYKLFAISSFWPLHVWYRFTSILFSIGSLITLYLLAKTLFSPKIAVYASLFFACLPYNIFYNRSIFPENALVFFSLLTLLLSVFIYRQSRWWLYGLMVLSGGLALLLKPMAVFMLFPLVIPAYYTIKQSPRRLVSWIFSLVIIILPLFLWRRFIAQFPEGIPASTWLLNSNGIRLRPAWFRWLFYERLTKLILGFGLIPIFISGLYSLFRGLLAFQKPSNHLTIKPFSIWFISFWIIGILSYLIIFATGNVHHDYYQIMTIPLICLILGIGVDYLFCLNRTWLTYLTLALVALGLTLAWSRVSGYYQINHGAIVKAGLAADKLLPQDALVIAPYMGDTAFLYQTNRRGWPLGFDLEKKISAGAQYYISVNYDDETNQLMAKYPVVIKNPDFVILKLQPTTMEPAR